MTNAVLYGSLGATGVPLTATLVSIDGSLVMAIGLAAMLVGGIGAAVALRRWRASRHPIVRSVAGLRRATV
jgi:hypothetical protein